MLYTVISEYDIFHGQGKTGQYLTVCGGMVEYTVSGKNKFVKSLFSTDPMMYLDKRYYPGTRINNKINYK